MEEYILTIEGLENELKKESLSNSIYLFYGEERFLLENCIKKIKKVFGEIILGINYIEIDETNIKSLIQEIETPVFGYEKKLIMVKSSGLFSKKRK